MILALLLLLAQTPAQSAMLRAVTAAKAMGCDPTLARHVYHPTRLKVYSRCLAVTGTLVDATNGKRKDGVRKEADGDFHGWVKLDPPFAALINSGNVSAEEGNLVIEAVCVWTPKQKDAIAACVGVTNRVVLPPVGSHVEILGVYVQDSNHQKWLEIHPVTRIKVLDVTPGATTQNTSDGRRRHTKTPTQRRLGHSVGLHRFSDVGHVSRPELRVGMSRAAGLIREIAVPPIRSVPPQHEALGNLSATPISHKRIDRHHQADRSRSTKTNKIDLFEVLRASHCAGIDRRLHQSSDVLGDVSISGIEHHPWSTSLHDVCIDEGAFALK